MVKIYKKVTTLIMAKLYHREISANFLWITLLMLTLAFMFSFYVFFINAQNSNWQALVGQGQSRSASKGPGLHTLAVHFLDIGQGDSIYIEAPNRNSMLIDSGTPDEKVIGEIQKFKNIFDRNLNVLLVTHADADHIGSMKKVIEKFKYQVFAYYGLNSETKLFQDLLATVHGHESDALHKTLTLTAGMSIVLDDGEGSEIGPVKFDVLFPDFDFQIGAYQDCKKAERDKAAKSQSSKSQNRKSKSAAKPKSTVKANTAAKKDPCLKFMSTETNLNSIVGKLSYGSTSFMLTGDSPVEVEKFIISKYGLQNKYGLYNNSQNNPQKSLRDNPLSIPSNNPQDKAMRENPASQIHPIDLRVDVLKLGHHGSKTSTSPKYLEALLPNFAVISVGKDNRYGHPNKSVLDIIDAFRNAHPDFQKTLRTDIDGTISFYSDGQTLAEQSSN
jgi:beta-lactamase superfamily II metal-dependent hydrolase